MNNNPKIIIQTCPARLWYVQDYLVPSLQDQGIDNIIIKNDKAGIGNLLSFILSCKDAGNAWHIQDDTLICSDFAKRIKKMDADQIACGFCAAGYDPRGKYIGLQPAKYIWYSTVCLYIPGFIADEFVNWFYNVARYDPKYDYILNSKKMDDELFRQFLLAEHPDLIINNMKTSLVEHIDHLIGGSLINQERVRLAMAVEFESPELVTQLAKNLAERSINK